MLIKDMLIVLEAYQDEKKIECKNLNVSAKKWEETSFPAFNFRDYDYRVKPVEPRHIYISVCVNPDDTEKASGFRGNAYTYQETKYNPEPAFQYIELTDEVRTILTEKGILKC